MGVTWPAQIRKRGGPQAAQGCDPWAASNRERAAGAAHVAEAQANAEADERSAATCAPSVTQNQTPRRMPERSPRPLFQYFTSCGGWIRTTDVLINRHGPSLSKTIIPSA